MTKFALPLNFLYYFLWILRSISVRSNTEQQQQKVHMQQHQQSGEGEEVRKRESFTPLLLMSQCFGT